MTVPIGRLEAQIGADFGDFQRAITSMERGLADVGRSVQQTGGPIADLERRVLQLTQAWRTGTISEEAYGAALRQLKVDVTGAASATSRTAEEMTRLAAIGGTVTGQLQNVTRVARRTAQGFEAVGVSALAAASVASRGIGGISAAAGALSVFAFGNPLMLGILSGLAALAMAWDLMSRRTSEATQNVSAFQRVNLAGITGGAFTRWMVAADAAFAARGTDDFARLNAEAQMYGRRYNDAVARVNDLLRRGIHGQPGMGLGDGPRGTSGPLGKGPASSREFQFQPTASATPTDMPGFKAFENSFEGATARMREMKESMGKELEGMKTRFASIDVFGGLASGLVQISEVVGQAIAGVGGGFRDIGKVILQVLGGLMKSVGQSLIAFGIAGKAIRSFAVNPVAAIAAGIALVALGSALSSSVSRQVSSGGGGGGSGLVSAPATGVSGEGRGNVTIIFPSGSVINPADPRQQDLILQMIEAAQGRNVQIRVGGA